MIHSDCSYSYYKGDYFLQKQKTYVRQKVFEQIHVALEKIRETHNVNTREKEKQEKMIFA